MHPDPIRSRRRLAPGVLALLACIGGATECSPASRHTVLATLFDGVPEPDTVAAVAADSAGPHSGAVADENAPLVPAQPALIVHPPFAEKKCSRCHTLEDEGRFAGDASLAAPERELCAGCHEEMALDRLRERYGWIHGPVAAGACTGCHSPHRSANERLLLAPADGALCIRCHDLERLRATETHEDVEMDCLDCHEAHGEVEPW